MVQGKRQTAERDNIELAVKSAINYASKIVLLLCNEALFT
jgi:hypothetical protein